MDLIERKEHDGKVARKFVSGLALIQLGLLCGVEAVFVTIFAGSEMFEHAYNRPSEATYGVITALFPVTAGIGSLISLFLYRTMFKKIILIISVYLWFIGYLLAALIHKMPVLLCARVLKGISIGIISSTIPLYAQAVFKKKACDMILAAVQAAVPAGIVWISTLSTFIYHQKTTNLTFSHCWLIGGVLVAPLVIECLFIQREASPVVTSSAHSIDPRLNKSLLNEKSNWPQQDMRQANLTVMEEVGVLMANKHYRKSLLSAVIAQCGIHITGINVVLYYTGVISTLAGFSIQTGAINSFAIYCVNFIATAVSLFTVDRIPLLASMRFSTLAISCLHGLLFLIMFMGQKIDGMDLMYGKTAIVIGGLIVFIFSLFYSAASFIFTAEAVPLTYRNTGVGLAIGIGWLFNAVLSVLAPIVMAKVGAFTFLIFCHLCVVLHVCLIIL